MTCSWGCPRFSDQGHRPRTLLGNELLKVAAVLAVVAVTVGIFVVGYSSWLPAIDPSPAPSPTRGPTPTPSPTESPSASPAVLLPEPAELLSHDPTAVLEFERSEGPADEPVSVDPAIRTIELDDLEFSGDVILAAACLGSGDLSIDIRWPEMLGGSDPFTGLFVPCGGQPTAITYAGVSSGSGERVPLQVLSVNVPRGASWRMAVGVRPDSGLLVPDDLTLVGVYVQCVGETTVTLSATHENASPTDDLEAEIPCPTDMPQRFELPVAAGEQIAFKATPVEPASIHLYLEGDAMPVSTYRPGPELPDGLADVAFMASNSDYAALGTLGGTRQTLIHAHGVPPDNGAGGDLVAININTTAGARLELYSASGGELVRVLAEHAPGFIVSTWVDPVHEQVFYALGSGATRSLDLHRVGLDGSGQQLLASAPVGEGVMALSLDYTAFLIDTCEVDAGCRRQVIDAQSLEISRFNVDIGGEHCDGLGTSDGLVVIRTGFSCQAFGADDTVVMALDGTGRRVLPDVGPGSLVRTSQGLRLVYRQSAQDTDLQVMDLARGASRSLGSMSRACRH